jgi:hypothetical protein
MARGRTREFVFLSDFYFVQAVVLIGQIKEKSFDPVDFLFA